jgi:hypothetical protein
VIAVVLVVVFGIGVSFIVLPSMSGAQSHAANTAPAATTAGAAAELPAPQTSAAARDAAAAPASNPRLAANSGGDEGSASGNDQKASAPKLE